MGIGILAFFFFIALAALIIAAKTIKIVPQATVMLIERLGSFNRVATSGLTPSSYTYDGDGLRQSKTVSGTTTAETWDIAAGLPLLVQDGSTRYVPGPAGSPLEQIASANIADPQLTEAWSKFTNPKP